MTVIKDIKELVLNKVKKQAKSRPTPGSTENDKEMDNNEILVCSKLNFKQFFRTERIVYFGTCIINGY